MAMTSFPGVVAFVPVPMQMFVSSNKFNEQSGLGVAPPQSSPAFDNAFERRRNRRREDKAAAPQEKKQWTPPMRKCATVFQKTAQCQYYPRCHKGSACRFAHAADEIRTRPNMSKTRMCAGFRDGRCKLSSEECNFAHGEHELRDREVPYFGVWTGKADYEAARAAAAAAALKAPAKGSKQRMRADSGRFGSESSGRLTPGAESATKAGSSMAPSVGSGVSTASDLTAFGTIFADETPAVSPKMAAASVSPMRWSDITDEVPTGVDASDSSEDVPGYFDQLQIYASNATPIDSVMSKWLSDIAASKTDSRKAMHLLPTPDECTAALMKAMPEYYED